MRPPADILILTPARTAETFTAYQHLSVPTMRVISNGLDRQSSIHINAQGMSLHCRLGDIPCQMVVLAIADLLRDQQSYPLPPVLPHVRELVLIGEGRLLLDQALAMAGLGKKVSLVRRRADQACRRVVNHYLARCLHRF